MLSLALVVILVVGGSICEVPTISQHSHSYREKLVGEEIKFVCKSNSIPKPNVTWYKDGIKIDPKTDNRYQLIEPDDDLFIPSVTDDVRGKYRCQLTNADGSHTIGWDLVLVIPYIGDTFAYAPRNDYFYPSDREAYANCQGPKGDPNPVITFINGSSNQTIDTNDPRISIRPVFVKNYFITQMIIKNAGMQDTSDRWACQATNIAGTKLSYFKIEYYGPPAAPSNIRIVHRLDGFIIKWNFVRRDIKFYEFYLNTTQNTVLKYKLPETTDRNKGYHDSYEIRNLDQGHRYVLKMRAVDEDNQIGEWSTPMNVDTINQSKPYIDAKMPLQTAVGEGMKYILKCNIRGEPIPDIEWIKDGVKINNTDSKYTMDNNKGELTINNLNRNYSNGFYQCAGKNLYGSIVNDVTTLTVQWIEKTFLFHPENATFYHGLNFIRISCRPPKASPEPRVFWLFNGRTIDPYFMPNFRIVNYNDPFGVLYYALEIRKPGSVLAGSYSCNAKNMGGERQAKFTVSELLPDKPLLVRSPSALDLIADQSKSTRMTCQIIGNPTPNVTWYHNNLQINPKNNSLFDITNVGAGLSSLILVSQSPSHQGNYYCKGTNQHGSALSSEAKVVVYYVGDEFQYWNNETYVYNIDRKKSVNITCRPPLGNPNTLIVWSNGTEDNLRYRGNPDLTYITKNVGEGLYVMQVDNPIKYLGQKFGCVAYNNKVGFAKYKLKLTEFVLVDGPPKLSNIAYTFASATKLKVSWSLERRRSDALFTVQVKKGAKVIYNIKTKELAHTVSHNPFQKGIAYSIVVTATDPVSQQSEMTKAIDTSNLFSSANKLNDVHIAGVVIGACALAMIILN